MVVIARLKVLWLPSRTDHYRFVLTHSALDGVLVSPRNPTELLGLLHALEDGPLDRDEASGRAPAVRKLTAPSSACGLDRLWEIEDLFGSSLAFKSAGQ